MPVERDAAEAPDTAQPEIASDDSLRDALSDALDASDAGAGDAPAEGGERTRDEAGRFAAAEKVQAEATAQPDAWRPVWFKDEYGDWQQLPEQLRGAMKERERAFSVELQRRAEAMRPWEGVSQTLQPLLPQLQAQGVSPDQFVGQLINAHQYLTQDPVAALQWLAQSYGVDLAALDGAADETPQPDPMVAQLQAEVQQLKSALGTLGQREAQQVQGGLQSEIAAFAKDKSDFDTLRPMIATLLAQGQAESLAQAYEMAQWAHPETRQRSLEAQRKTQAAQAGRARAAGVSNLKGAPVAGGASTQNAGLRDMLEAAWDGA